MLSYSLGTPLCLRWNPSSYLAPDDFDYHLLSLPRPLSSYSEKSEYQDRKRPLKSYNLTSQELHSVIQEIFIECQVVDMGLALFSYCLCGLSSILHLSSLFVFWCVLCLQVFVCKRSRKEILRYDQLMKFPRHEEIRWKIQGLELCCRG